MPREDLVHDFFRWSGVEKMNSLRMGVVTETVADRRPVKAGEKQRPETGQPTGLQGLGPLEASVPPVRPEAEETDARLRVQ